MALTLSDVGLEAKDQGVLKCAWIVQINGVVVFETKIHSCQITIMRSVCVVGTEFLDDYLIFTGKCENVQ